MLLPLILSSLYFTIYLYVWCSKSLLFLFNNNKSCSTCYFSLWALQLGWKILSCTHHKGLGVLGAEQSSGGNTPQVHSPKLLLQAPQPHNRFWSSINRAATSELRDPQERSKKEVTPKTHNTDVTVPVCYGRVAALPVNPVAAVPKRRNGLSLSNQISPGLVIQTSKYSLWVPLSEDRGWQSIKEL